MPHPHLGRRALLAGALILPLAPRLAHGAPRALTFAVFRNGAKIGEHHMGFTGDSEALTATTEVVMTVKLGPVPVFKYQHRAVERREGAAFASLETSSVTNGKAEHVIAEKTAAGIAVTCASGRTLLGADANPMTHWNPRIFDGPLFHPQTGKLLRVRATRPAANHVAIRGEVEMDDFYDDAGVWQAARAKGDDGSTIEYRRT